MRWAALALTIAMLLQLAPSVYAASAELFPETVKGDSIVIGAVFNLTEASNISVEALCGIKAAIEWVNDRGGIFIKGKRYFVQLAYFDYGGNIEGVSEAASMLKELGVRIILAPPEWEYVEPLASELRDTGSLLIVYSYVNEGFVRGLGSYGIHVLMPVAPLDMLVEGAFRAASKLDPDASVFIAASSSRPWAEAASPSKLRSYADKYGLNYLDQVRIDPANVERIAGLIESNVSELRPDIMIVVGERDVVVETLKSIYGGVSVNGVVVAGEGFDNWLYSDLTPLVAENVVVVSDWLPIPQYDPEKAASLGYEWWGLTHDVFYKFFSDFCPAIEPSSIAARAASALLITVKLIADAGSLEPSDLLEAVPRHGVMTFYGPIVIERLMVSEFPITFAQFREGRLETADFLYPAPNWSAAEGQEAQAPAVGAGEEVEGGQAEQGLTRSPAILVAGVVAVLAAIAAVAFLLKRRG